MERDLRVHDVGLVADEKPHDESHVDLWPYEPVPRYRVALMNGVESEDAHEELSALREQVEACERSRRWRLHPRYLFRPKPTPEPRPSGHRGFDSRVLAEIREGARRSAGVVAPIVQPLVGARSVVDLGGGEGWWAHEFASLGVRAVSIDAATIDDPAPGISHVQHDLGAPISDLAQFDLALCLEVAEHLDAPAGDQLVKTACSAAPVVLFSAAIPGQGGCGHVNEQWPAYWFERFERSGYRCSGALRWRLWDDDRIEPWYRQNLLLATDRPELFPELFATPLAEPWPVVHPATFKRARGRT
jgi:hypothetical protein